MACACKRGGVNTRISVSRGVGRTASPSNNGVKRIIRRELK